MLKPPVLLGVLLILVTSGTARIINVPADSVTIQQAIDLADDGDTVLVAPGTYYEYLDYHGRNVVVGSHYLTTNDTSYISATVLDGRANGKIVSFVNGEDSTAVVTGFTIYRGFAWFGHGAGIYCDGASPTIRSNVIKGCVAYYSGGGIYVGNLSPRIEDNIIIGNRASKGGGGGIFCDYGSRPTIINNIIAGNETDVKGGGICCLEADPLIINNTIAANSADSSGGGLYCYFSAPEVTNCIFWDNVALSGPHVDVIGTEVPSLTYCDLQGGWEGEGNIDTMPLFVAPVDEDYSLCAQSACIDAGDPSLTDPDGSRSDIGRYEADPAECDIGAVIHVSIEGNDETGDGSEVRPYRTIQRGIDIAFPGDTVLIESGIYAERINFKGKSLVVGSHYIFSSDRWHIESTVIDGGAGGAVVTFDHGEDSSSVLTGLTIRNGLDKWNEFGAGIRCFESNPTISHNIITDNQGSGICCEGSMYNRISPRIIGNTITDNVSFYGGGIDVTLSKPLVSENLISRNQAKYGGGIWLSGAQATVTHNIIHGNFAETGGGIYDIGIRSHIQFNTVFNNTAEEVGGGYHAFYSDPRLLNNTFYGNSAAMAGGLNCVSGAEPIITNTIFWGNHADSLPDVYISSSSNAVITYCNFPGGWEGEGNIDADPLFCDPALTDFALAETSPCAGTGLDGANIGAFGIGCVATGMEDTANDELPEEFSLLQNYPNPFNPSTVIEYSLNRPAAVTLVVYNVLGREVKTLVNHPQAAGRHKIRWDATDNAGEVVASGIYFYRLQAGDLISTKKMVLVM